MRGFEGTVGFGDGLVFVPEIGPGEIEFGGAFLHVGEIVCGVDDGIVGAGMAM